MAFITWPETIPGSGSRVLRDGFEGPPASNLRSSATDQSVRTRRISTARRREFQMTIRMSYDEFDNFELWVQRDLKDGSLPFLWQPPRRPYLALSEFVESDGRAYTAQPISGRNVNVTFTIRFFDRAFSNA